MRRALVPILVAMALTPAAEARPAPPLSVERLLERISDPVARLEPLPGRFRTLMVSSHDRSGGNVDGGSYGGVVTATGFIPPSFVRSEAGGAVLYEVRRPGCLTRAFFASVGPPLGDASAFGRLQLLVDGEAEPRFDEPMAELFAGEDPRYPQPLVGNWQSSSGGNYSYIPVCFRRSLTVRTSNVPPDGLGWWELNLIVAPQGTRVRPFDPDMGMRGGAVAIARAGHRPAGRAAFSSRRNVAPGVTTRFARLRGTGTIRHLGFAVDPFNATALAALRLRVRAGRARRPQVDVPLGALFGDGLEIRPVSAAAFGMDPDRGSGYLALPIPYRHGVRVAVRAGVEARVRITGWAGEKPPRDAGRLHGAYDVLRPGLGSDTEILAARGSGRMASVVLDYIDGGPVSGVNPLQRFLEGDERIHIDGSRSPAFYGTGHEELSNAGLYFSEGEFTGKLGGAGPFGSTPDLAGTQSQYRVYADDGPKWSSAIAYGHEHGGGDEQPVRVGVTTLSYRAGPRLSRTDRIDLGDAGDRRSHQVRGDDGPVSLSAYFEGQRDGNSTNSTIVAGGFYYGAPAPEDSPEGFSADGVRFSGPLTARLRTRAAARGVVLRGLFDQAGPLEVLQVEINGRPAGLWQHPAMVPGPDKRWLEDDFDLPPRLTRGRRQIRVTLTPADGSPVSLFELGALSRRR